MLVVIVLLRLNGELIVMIYLLMCILFELLIVMIGRFDVWILMIVMFVWLLMLISFVLNLCLLVSVM